MKTRTKYHFVISKDSVKNPQSKALINLDLRFGLMLNPSFFFSSFLCHKVHLVTLSLVTQWSYDQGPPGVGRNYLECNQKVSERIFLLHTKPLLSDDPTPRKPGKN